MVTPTVDDGGDVIGAADGSNLNEHWDRMVEIEPARLGLTKGCHERTPSSGRKNVASFGNGETKPATSKA